ncbi:MAG: hypothetical protein HFJ06_03805 [Lachnospiraceae bacterium]|nr:hypothetical protein [Lachnospiraceae bacterium]
MEKTLKELAFIQTGTPLDEELKKRTDYIQRQAEWRNAENKFNDMFKMTNEQWHAFDDIEDAFLAYNAICIEAAYKLGYEDGILVGMEQMPDGRKSVLSLEDMTHLISVYDSIRQLKKVLLGRMNEHWEDDGAFSVFERVFDVIYNAASAKIQFLEDDEAIKIISDVLADESMESKEKARQLLEIK